MKKFLRPLLLIAALLFSQHAAMLHGLAHAGHDVAVAQHAEGKAPALDHGTDVCAAYGAVAHAVGNTPAMWVGSREEPGNQTATFQVFSVSPRIAFDSRAPPYSA